MSKALTQSELETIYKEYVGFDSLTTSMQDEAKNLIRSVLRVAKAQYGKDRDDDPLTRAHKVSMDTVIASYESFDAFLCDNLTGVTFADVSSKHSTLRASLLCLYVIKEKMTNSDGVDELRSGRGLDDYERLADIYTAKGLGVHESAAWGGRRIICSEDYPFYKNNQAALKDTANLSVIPYSEAQANNDLAEKIKLAEEACQ
ncbi:conserved hypothetical protein [Vibrio chagasii]|nr:conserved hypothetical protein [Vibrio chagasii]